MLGRQQKFLQVVVHITSLALLLKSRCPRETPARRFLIQDLHLLLLKRHNLPGAEFSLPGRRQESLCHSLPGTAG